MGHQLRKLCRNGCAHDQDRVLNACLAQSDALVRGGHTEPADGQFLQCAANFNGAVSVGIGLHDGQHIGARGQSPHVGHILSKGGQIDGG